MSRARSRAEQEQIVAAWRRSGKGAREFAARAGVSAGSLYRWGSLLRSAQQQAALVEVVASEALTAWDWEVEFASGKLRARGSLDATTARMIVEALACAGRR